MNSRNVKITGDKLYYSQALLLIISYRLLLALTYTPALVTTHANQDVWIMLLLSIPYAILISLPILYLGNKFNQYDFFEYTEMIAGKIIGKILAVLYSFAFLSFFIFFSSVFIEILNTALYNQTPTIVNTVILLATCSYVVSKGIMNLARLGEIVIPFIIIVFLLLAVLGIGDYDFTVFLPILKESTFKDLNIGAIDISFRYIDVLVLAMLIPYLEDKKDVNKIFIKSLVCSTIFSILAVVVIQATLGIEYSKRINFSYYTYTRLIKIGETQGFDLLYVASWIMGNIIKLSGYFYFATTAMANVTKKRNQFFIIPVAVISVAVIVFLKDYRPVIAARDPFKSIFRIISIIFIIIIPLIILIIYFFRRKTLNKTGGAKRK